MSGWSCGLFHRRIWKKSSKDKRILIRDFCAFPSAVHQGVTARWFDACQWVCLDDNQCNAFSYNEVEENCILLHHTAMQMTKAASQRWSFTELLRLRSPLDSGQTISHHCGLISTRNWKVDGVDNGVLYQDDCDYNKGFDIGNPQRLDNVYQQCALHCLIFNVPRPCTHFSYNRNSGICDMKFVPRVTDRETIGVSEKKMCGFIPSRLMNVTTSWSSSITSR